MFVEVTEHNIAKNLAYQKFPEFVAATKRANMLNAAKELYESGGIQAPEYHDLLRELLKAEGCRIK